MKELEPQKQFHIKQVAAIMAIEDMPIDKQTRKNLTQIAVGEKTVNQLIREIKKEYKDG
ncbi:hypothetical protein AALA36_17630 [Lachnospiraceae bacterium 66-29]